MSLAAFYDEELIEIDGYKLTLAVDFRAIDLAEHLLGKNGSVMPMPEAVGMLFSEPPPLRALGNVLFALLRRKHEDITLDEAAGLVFGPHRNRVRAAICGLLLRAMNLGEKKEKDENPSVRRGASKPS